MHCVLETDVFARAAKAAGISDEERQRIAASLSEDPLLGELIPGAGGARKWRFPKAGGGKRGGYRIVTYFAADDVPVFLLDLFDKGEKVNLSQAEKNELRRALSGVADNYRTAMATKVTRLTESAS